MTRLGVLGLGLGLAFTSAIAVANDADNDTPWGVKELKAAASSATERVRQQFGQTAYDSISGFSVDKTIQENSAKARVNYKEGTSIKTANYFCHTHDNDIDCH